MSPLVRIFKDAHIKIMTSQTQPDQGTHSIPKSFFTVPFQCCSEGPTSAMGGSWHEGKVGAVGDSTQLSLSVAMAMGIPVQSLKRQHTGNTSIPRHCHSLHTCEHLHTSWSSSWSQERSLLFASTPVWQSKHRSWQQRSKAHQKSGCPTRRSPREEEEQGAPTAWEWTRGCPSLRECWVKEKRNGKKKVKVPVPGC